MPQDYEFEVTITAVVRVRAENEASPLLLGPLALKRLF
jgi:hypothetical protein